MIKKLSGILLCFLLLSVMLLPVSATEAEEPVIPIRKIEISTAEEFLEFAENCRLDSFSQNLEVYLTEDIDLTGRSFDGVPTFGGTFWGKRHSISGVTITSDGSNQGLFRYLTEGAVVRDLNVEGKVQPGGSCGNVGGIVGTNSGEVRNCSFSGTVSGGDCVGGITGENTVTGIIHNCSAAGEIHGDHFVGGIAGRNYGVIRNAKNEARVNTTPQQNTVELSDITLDNMVNSEAVNTATDIGGIAGISSGVIRDSENHAAVGYRQMAYNIGGIAGTQSGYIVDCSNYGDIQGRKEVGGIVGQMEPVTVIEFTEDTLQILKGQLNTMSGLVNQASGNAQSNASQITGKIAILQDQAQTAKDAVQTLFQEDDVPDLDTILAAQSTLTKTMEAMPGTMRSIASAAQSTVSGLSKDLNAISGQISAMGSTLNHATENLGGTITDVSDLDTPDQQTGKLENCTNIGAVLADLNAGGIAGAIAMENDLDVWEDLQQLGDSSLNFNSEVRAVMIDCVNSGTVTGKKQNAGGIVGWQSLGLVKNCTNTGRLDAAGADHVGGVCGAGSGFVRNCYANCEISGDTYVGGIGGSGTIVTDSLAQVKFSGGKERIGGILGWADDPLTQTEDPIRGNYYLPVDADIGAVDGISYADQAQPLELSDFLALEDLPDTFKSAFIRFRFEDGTVETVKVPIGSTLSQTQIPEIPEKKGFRSKWIGLDEAELSDIVFDMSFDAEYTAFSTTIASDATREDGRPLLLLEGSFDYDAVVTIEESADAPELEKNQAVMESWIVTATYPGTQARFLLPDPDTADTVKLYVCDDGNWQELPAQRDNSYLVFPMTSEQLQIALVQEHTNFTLWIIAGAAVIAVIAAAVLITIKKKRSSKGQTIE